jgi:hypothetical protein
MTVDILPCGAAAAKAVPATPVAASPGINRAAPAAVSNRVKYRRVIAPDLRSPSPLSDIGHFVDV